MKGEVTHYVVTVIEGWEFRKMRAVVDANPALRHDTAGMSDADLMKAIGATEPSPEGLFFPDTYLFARGSSDVELYRHAYRAMQKRLNEAWNARAPDLRTRRRTRHWSWRPSSKETARWSGRRSPPYSSTGCART